MARSRPPPSGNSSTRASWYRRGIAALLTLAAVLVALSGQPSARAWSGDPAVNTAICTAAQNQLWNNQRPNIVGDTSGGAIITWHDYRSGNYDIYAQKVDSTGTPRWGTDGLSICAASGIQNNPTLISDGAGGAIITWYDTPSSGIFAQRVDADGTLHWGSGNVPICPAVGTQNNPTLVSDGAGGAIITWYDSRVTGIYAQRVNADGVVLWGTSGVPVCAATGIQQDPNIASDGSGGAIITWEDNRTSATRSWDIYAQRVNSLGGAEWPADGVAICDNTSTQQNPSIVSDGAGGAVIVWEDNRSGNYDIYAQRVSASGELVTGWPAYGTTICNATGNQQYPILVSDAAGGAIITWQDSRNNIYARRVYADSSTWSSVIDICNTTGTQQYPVLVSDSSGGAIIAWQDSRSGNYDIYARRVNASGESVTGWSTTGQAVSTAAGTQQYPAITGDGSGGAIVTWRDYRSSSTYCDIYAQRIKSDGSLPAPPTVTSVSRSLGDQGQTLSNITITGTNFRDGATSVSFGSGIAVGPITVNSATQLTVSIGIDPAAALGDRDVSVTTPDGVSTLPGSFTVCAALEVSFSADRTAAVVGENVSFTSNSSGGATPLNYDWAFGDSGTSTVENATHAYFVAGTYTVVLQVTDLASNVVTSTRNGYINVYDAPQAEFTADRRAVVTGQSIAFANLSTGGIAPLSYEWDFDNDGTWDDTAENPTCAYPSPGTHTVVLRITDSAAHADTETKADYIVVSDDLQADFSADRTAVVVGQSISFSDGSTGGVAPLACEWDFGDGNTGNDQHPAHAYSSTGTYTVTLQVSDSAANSATKTKANFITVFPALQAGFTADDTVAIAGQDIHFTNGSSGGVAPLACEWRFGDGETGSDQHPSHAYSSSGTYTVVIEVSDSAANSATKTRANYIIVVRSCDSTSSATGTGTVEICTSAGALENLEAVSEASAPANGKPAIIFGHGLFAFSVTGLSNGESITLTITLPSDVPTTAQYWKYGPTSATPSGEWYPVPLGSNDGDNVITITLTDGGLGDDDLAADGTIIDQGGPGTPRPPEPTPVFPSVYAGIAAALGAGAVAWLIRWKLGNR